MRGSEGVWMGQSVGWKIVGGVVLVFLVFLALHLWWESSAKERQASGDGVIARPAQVGGNGEKVEIGSPAAAPAERSEAHRQEQKRLLGQLAQGQPEERRAAALRLQYVADESAEPTLLKMLRDKDPLVAERCAGALVGLWQQSRSQSVNRLFGRGLAAYEAGRYDEALDDFKMSASLDPRVPDLYRLRAEILLEKGEPGKALNECQQAISLKLQNFMAHYVQARCYRETGDLKAAMESVDRALSIYGGFQKAYQLKVEILSLQKAAGE